MEQFEYLEITYATSTIHKRQVMMLQWAKCSRSFSIHWCIRMLHVKNYEITSKFVEVMPRILNTVDMARGYLSLRLTVAR